MADKQLTETAWKAFSKGKSYKDAGLLKAFAALDKAEKGGPDAELEALDAIEKEADALLKANKADKDLSAYLGDVDKALQRERKAAGQRAKDAAKQSDGDDEEDTPALLTGKMIPVLRQVRKGDAAHAMVAIAGKETAVLMMRRPIAPARRKLLAEYLGVSGGMKVVMGTVVLEENAVTFVLATAAAGLAKRLKAALLAQTEQRVKVRVRGESPDDVDDDGEEAELEGEQGSAGGGQVPEAPPAPPADLAAAQRDSDDFKARLAALLPRIKDAVTRALPTAADVRQKAAEAGAAAAKKDFTAANGLLDQAEQLLDSTGEVPVAPPTAPTVDAAKAFNARLTAMQPAIKAALAGPAAAQIKAQVAAIAAAKGDMVAAGRALDAIEALIEGGGSQQEQQEQEGQEEQEEEQQQASPEEQSWDSQHEAIQKDYERVLAGNPAEATKIRATMGFAIEQAEAKQFGRAVNALVMLRKMLDAAVPSQDTPERGLVAYRQSLLEFRAAFGQVQSQIAGLKKAIPAQLPDQADLADELEAELTAYNDELMELVDQAINTAKDERAPIDEAIRSQIDAYIGEVAQHPLIQHVDSNPFGAQVGIADLMGKALARIRASMPDA